MISKLARIAVLIALCACGASLVWAQDEDGPMSNMHFVVVREYNGKPVRNAAVVLHPVTTKGKQARGGLELKTDSEGRAGIDGIPYGPLRIQVLAPGFKTFGEDYNINQAETEIVVKLRRPGQQYSVYENHPAETKPEEKKPEEKKEPEQKPSEQKPQ